MTDSANVSAASQLPEVPPPKVKPKQQSWPSIVNSTRPTTAAYLLKDRRVANTDLLNFRTGTTSREVVRNLAATSPDLSAALFAMIRVGLTEHYRCFARDMSTGQIDGPATELAHQLLRRFDLVGSYDDGFSQVGSLRSNAESLAKELVIYGGAAMELVLDQARLPKRFSPFSSTSIQWYQDPKDPKSLAPKQVVAGEFIDLDFPTIFYVSLDQDLLTPYSDSPLEAAIQPVLADSEFTNDLRRVLKRSIHPRVDSVMDGEILKSMAPPDAQNDPAKMNDFLASVKAEVEATINNAAPEDAFIHFDSIELKYLEGQASDTPGLYKAIQDILNSKMAAGSKALPSVLGHGAGTQNVASSETLMFMKNANGAIRVKLNELFSRAMTLAVRLFGLDVAVTFEWEEIDLRPVGELEAFKSMYQARVLEQLSLGFITDDEASVMLTGNMPPAGMPKLQGTMFSAGLSRGGGENPYSGTSNGGAGGGALNQSLKPGTPQQPKGASK